MQDKSEGTLLTVNGVARRLRLHPGTVYKMLQSGVLKGKKIDPEKKFSEWRVDSIWLEEWIKS